MADDYLKAFTQNGQTSHVGQTNAGQFEKDKGWKPSNARRFALYVAVAATVLMILFPPFSVSAMGGSITEYGFLFSGPPSVRQAVGAAVAFGGKQGQDMAHDMFHYAPDFIRLLIQLALVWLMYLAAVRTVLRPRQVVSGPGQSS